MQKETEHVENEEWWHLGGDDMACETEENEEKEKKMKKLKKKRRGKMSIGNGHVYH